MLKNDSIKPRLRHIATVVKTIPRRRTAHLIWDAYSRSLIAKEVKCEEARNFSWWAVQEKWYREVYRLRSRWTQPEPATTAATAPALPSAASSWRGPTACVLAGVPRASDLHGRRECERIVGLSCASLDLRSGRDPTSLHPCSRALAALGRPCPSEQSLPCTRD